MGTDLTVEIAGIRMKHPVMVASGTFGYGPEYADLVDLNALGALVVKGISAEPWAGNAVPRMVEVPGGLINAIGLQNPGVQKFIDTTIPFLEDYTVPLVVNVWGKCIEEYVEVATRLSAVSRVDALELNISCPNIKQGGIAFGTCPDMAAEVVAAVRAATTLPIIPKLSPNVSDAGAMARAVADAGADAVSLINSIPAMVIDVETRTPVLANRVGGLSGPAVHPVAVKQVVDVAAAVDVPIIAMGGITGPREALEFFIAGATAVAVGTANFTDPMTWKHVVDGIEAYLQRHNLNGLNELIGSLKA